jgi:hypothetical protein
LAIQGSRPLHRAGSFCRLLRSFLEPYRHRVKGNGCWISCIRGILSTTRGEPWQSAALTDHSRHSITPRAKLVCRNIRTLFNSSPRPRKKKFAPLRHSSSASSTDSTPPPNNAAFDHAVDDVARTAARICSLVTTAEPRDREVEAERARTRCASTPPKLRPAAR